MQSDLEAYIGGYLRDIIKDKEVEGLAEFILQEVEKVGTFDWDDKEEE